MPPDPSLRNAGLVPSLRQGPVAGAARWSTGTRGLQASRVLGLGLLGAWLLLAGGCKHKAVITSDPPGAEVRVRGRYVGVTPIEVKVSRMPWVSNKVRVNLHGRRWTEVKLSRWKRKSEHEVLLVRQHGRAGTWTPEEAEKK
jgi:hypothetical protein